MRSNGVCEKTSRATEVTIGIIMMASTTPATNGERVKTGVETSKSGIQLKYLCNSFAQYSALGIKIFKPQSPKRIDGKAAMRSTTETRIPRIKFGA